MRHPPESRDFHLATLIALAITVLVVVSTLTISGILYFSLQKSLTVEFEERVKAESREIGQALSNRFRRVETRLKALTLDNTVRVTLKLGAGGQLKEHLRSLYTSDPDIHFFVEDSEKKYSSVASTIEFKRHEIWQALSSPLAKLTITNDMAQHGFKLTYVLPVIRQQKRIGLAAAVYIFHQDNFLKSIVKREHSNQLITIENGAAWNLFSGKMVPFPTSLLFPQKDSERVNYLELQSGNFVAIAQDKFPDLFFVASLRSLESAKKQVLYSVMFPAFCIILLSWFVAILLSNRLVLPLQQLSKVAMGISRGEAELKGVNADTRIMEFNQLRVSFKAMIRHLQQAREMERYQELFEGVADIVFIHDLDGRMIDVNEVALNKLGFVRTDLIQKKLTDLVPKQQHSQIIKALEDLDSNKNQIVFSTVFTDYSGTNIFSECHARRIIYNNREVVLNVVRDITARRQAENALKESHRTLLTILDSIQATIYVCDLEENRILFMNEHMIEVTGNNLVGRKCTDFFQHIARPCRYCTKLIKSENIIKSGPQKPWEGQNPVNKKWYLHHDKLIDWIDGRQAKFQIAYDISDLKELALKKEQVESQLRKMQKMEAIGTLAGGVAHDLNNILSGIVSFPDVLLMQVSKDSPLRGPLTTIKKSGLKASATVNDLLTLARRGVVVNEVVNINDVVSDYLDSPEHARLLKDHKYIDFDVDLQPDILSILGSSVHLTKSVMNLVTNAAEAIQGSGTISIATSGKLVESIIPINPDFRKGEYVVLAISDDGCGISPKDGERIFEPFFTTKVMGRSGTGLGMAVVWGTVEDHEGYIELDSTPGQGTTFKLYFPITRAELLKEQAALSQKDLRGNGESILVVDDIKEQRDIATMMFSQLGYQVLTADSGEEAVAFLKNNSVDLVLLDMIMEGGMNGLETYKIILEMHPGQKAIIATGYSKTAHVTEALELGVGQYIKKPFLFEEIAKAVWSELNKDSSAT